MEKVINPGPSNTLNSDLFDKPSLDHLSIGIDESINQAEYHRPFFKISGTFVSLKLNQLSLLLLEVFSDLLVQRWNASLNVVNQDLVQRICQVRDTKVLAILGIHLVTAKEVTLLLDCLSNSYVVVYLLLGSAFDSEIAKL